ILRTMGVPPRVRGSVYVLPYWHLTPVLERLAQSAQTRPVLDPWRLPDLDLATLARIAARGGWVGYPGARNLRRSRRHLATAVTGARTEATESEPLGSLLDGRALDMLEQRAADTLAVVDCMRRSFGSGRMRLAVLPNDSAPDARSVLSAAR